MSFRQFGGLQYSAKNNIITNHYSNSSNLGVTDAIGQPHSTIVSQSNIDMSGNSILNIGNLHFADGKVYTAIINVLIQEIQDLKDRVLILENR